MIDNKVALSKELRPQLPALKPEIRDTDDLRRITDSLRKHCDRHSPPTYFGADLRAAYTLIENGTQSKIVASKSPFTEIYVPIDRVFSRPAPEPIILAHWDTAKAWSWSPDILLSFSSYLLGERAQIRRSPIGTSASSSGYRIVYPEHGVAEQYVGRIANPMPYAQDCPITWAFYCYAQVSISHPLVDGNGRLARALLICALGYFGVISGPWLPISSSMYHNAAALAEACFFFNGDITQIQLCAERVLSQAIYCMERDK